MGDEVIAKLPNRLCLVVKLRESEEKSFVEIGDAIGCSRQWARQLYRRAKRLQDRHGQDEPYYGLSNRAARCCINLGLLNREQIANAIKNYTLHPCRCRHFGWKSYDEVLNWLRT